MTTAILNGGVVSASGNQELTTIYETASVAFATDWQKFVKGSIIAQLSGSASAVVAVVERSATNPNSEEGAHASPADADGFSGDLSAGIAPNEYDEASFGWWRINVTTVTSGDCTASLSGIGG